jgi:hypothetical protein
LGAAVPLWFNEGLAEYYSTFDVQDGDRKVILGDLVDNHVLYLRENKLVPRARCSRSITNRRTTTKATNEYLLLRVVDADALPLAGRRPEATSAIGQFMDLLRSKVPIAEAFQRAFENQPRIF